MPDFSPITTRKYTLSREQTAWIASLAQTAALTMSDVVGAALDNLHQDLSARNATAIALVETYRQARVKRLRDHARQVARKSKSAR